MAGLAAFSEAVKFSALILRRPPLLGGRLEGWRQTRRSKWPSFETRR